MEKIERKKETERELEVLITFLERTKEGEYAPIEKSSLIYARFKEETAIEFYDEEYYYSIS